MPIPIHIRNALGFVCGLVGAGAVGWATSFLILDPFDDDFFMLSG